MDRRAFITLLGGSVLAAPLATKAQQAGKVPKVGWLSMGTPASPMAVTSSEAFRQGLRDNGYLEGQNITVEYRYAEGKPERFPEFAAEFVRLQVEVIVAGAGTVAAIGARKVTTTIPIVMSISGDPVALGLAASLSRPGSNVTGQTQLSPEMSWKRLELLNDIRPVQRVAILWNPTNPEAARSLQETQAAARRLGAVAVPVEARSPDALKGAHETASRANAKALVVLNDPMFVTHRLPLIEAAQHYKLPAVYPWKEAVVDGGLMSYGPNLLELHRSAANYVAKILRGAKPGDLPIAEPTKFELVLNLKTAKALGLMIPQSLLVRADEIIQ